uniref:ZMYM2-like/QRICH1 C-terminal domain-containing protein n=1 Tax=Ficedula albicollis TaxID=59894 RepID=U3KHM9_FICAL
MGENAGDSSLQADLSNLVIWAHSHGTICKQIPALEFMQNVGHMSNDNAVLWMCKAGHAYHWHCGKSHERREEENEAVGRRKRVLSSESLARESSFEEKRPKLTPSSLEMDQADSGSTASCGRSQGVAEEKADSAYTRNNKPSRSQNAITSENMRKPITSFSAAEQHFSVSGRRVQTGEEDMKSESDDDLQIISDEEQCEADEDNQGDRISQDNVSEPSAEELQLPHCQKIAMDQPTASQRAAFAPRADPPLARAYILQAPASNSDDPSRSILRLGSAAAAGPKAEISRARSLLGSAAPKVCFKPLPVPSTEARAQLESQPSVIFFELQATAAFQQRLQLSPPEYGTPRAGSSGDSAENVGEDSETSGSRQTPCSSGIQSPERCPPAASGGDVLKKQNKKKSYTTEDIKVFKDWLKLHHPSETRKIHTLPPADLDRYLVSFFSSAKKKNGMDFSANSLNFFQHNIDLYLRSHDYQYNILRGPEFRASQEAFKLKHWSLCQKGKEEKWSVVENLTDEDVENLRKKEILSKAHPHGLLHLVLTNLIRGFGASTHQQPHQLCWGQVVLRKTKGEVEYLEWKDDLSPGGNEGELNPRLFAKPEDPENCPVASYKEYARRRPLDMLSDNHPLYLSPKSLCSLWDNVWYSKKALTKAKTDKIFKIIMQQVGGAIRKTRK